MNQVLSQLLRDQAGFFDTLGSAPSVLGLNLTLLAIIIASSGLYGLVMGAARDPRQAIASAVKVPLLFLSTLAICFPLLAIVTLLLGLTFALSKLLAAILFALAIAAGPIASCATIALFFIVTGSGYDFMKLLHVGVFSVGGVWGMVALCCGLVRSGGLGGLSITMSGVVMLVWIALYAFVGAQMAWTLRPFMAGSGLRFELMRKRTRGMNFYTALAASLDALGKHESKSEFEIKEEALP